MNKAKKVWLKITGAYKQFWKIKNGNDIYLTAVNPECTNITAITCKQYNENDYFTAMTGTTKFYKFEI